VRKTPPLGFAHLGTTFWRKLAKNFGGARTGSAKRRRNEQSTTRYSGRLVPDWRSVNAGGRRLSGEPNCPRTDVQYAMLT